MIGCMSVILQYDTDRFTDVSINASYKQNLADEHGKYISDSNAPCQVLKEK